MICPKCNYERIDEDDPQIPDYECPACGIIYEKYKPKPKLTDGQPSVFSIDESLPVNIFRNPPKRKPSSAEPEQSTPETEISQHKLKAKLTLKGTIYTFLFAVIVFNVIFDEPAEKPKEYTSKTVISPTVANRPSARPILDNTPKTASTQSETQAKKEAECINEEQCAAVKIFTPAVRSACFSGLESMALYRYKWTDKWYENRIVGYRWKDSSKTVMQGIGKNFEIENGFGAWQQVYFACEVNALDSKLVNISIENKAGRILAGGEIFKRSQPKMEEYMPDPNYRNASPEQLELMRQREREIANEY